MPQEHVTWPTTAMEYRNSRNIRVFVLAWKGKVRDYELLCKL